MEQDESRPQRNLGQGNTERGSIPLPNPRHEKFATYLAGGMSSPQAYVAAGYSENGARISAHRLSKQANIADRIAYLSRGIQTEAATRVVLDREFVLLHLKENLLMAMGKMDAPAGKKGEPGRVYEPSAANQAIRLLGLELGMFREASDHKITWDGDVAKLTQQQLDTLLASLGTRLFAGDPAALAEAEREAVEGLGTVN